MRNLLLFVWKHYFFFVFLLLETLCIYLLVQNSYYQRASFINSSNRLSADVTEASTNIRQYFYLKDVNEKLSRENAELRSRLLESYSLTPNEKTLKVDTAHHQKYIYVSAKVVSNTTNRRNNYITLDKGSDQGIVRDMTVITNDGIVGRVKDVSKNFCTVMSMLHSQMTVSAKLKKDGSPGPLTWEGESYEYATLNDIPTHVRIIRGDTVVTSGYADFPENIRIGTVESFVHKSRENFYTVQVKLLTDFRKLTYVYIVDNLYKDEEHELEQRSQNDKEKE